MSPAVSWLTIILVLGAAALFTEIVLRVDDWKDRKNQEYRS